MIQKAQLPDKKTGQRGKSYVLNDLKTFAADESSDCVKITYKDHTTANIYCTIRRILRNNPDEFGNVYACVRDNSVYLLKK